MSERKISNPLDVFAVSDQDRQILDIYVQHLATVSPRKRKAATEFAMSTLRASEVSAFKDALARSLSIIEKNEQTEH